MCVAIAWAAQLWLLIQHCGCHVLQPTKSYDPSYLEKLWSGTDVEEADIEGDSVMSLRGAITTDEAKGPSEADCVRSMPGTPPEPQESWNTIPGHMPRRVLIYGPMDSGTNLLEDILTQNFPDMLDFSMRMWKHSLDTSHDLTNLYATLSEVFGSELQQTTLFIMVRSPISQVVSWHNAPYALKQCLLRDWSEMASSCNAAIAPRIRDCGDIRKQLETFSSTMAIYNSYMRQYQKLVSDGRFAKVFLVPYEDLLSSTTPWVKEFSEGLELPMPAQVTIPSDPSKTHGDAVGRDAAIAKLQAREWLDEVGAEGVRSLCQDLDRESIATLLENHQDREAEPVPYARDCEAAA